ncbi:signal peptidase I [Evansella cellulosilytica]|uniref:Signal peptidase I n=1 Tax=Evansella cellulosilytica (strain ATCC 21833 / DSM 2522 / FERM P-1141 / JCM 9156 / N-4) TaxID=649639 RepID=E6TWQ0_EVAC2|nr:signal peptidase I [Evansella cellulosilytica]ADU28733.1 signal peptidase I [Evansella cellulosilytica DSM 2522]
MTFIKEMISWVKSIAVALVLAVLISIFVVQPFKVDGSSMEPTLMGADNQHDSSADRLFVLKTPYLFGATPNFGDIVIVDSRLNNERSWKDVLLENQLISLFTDREESNDYMWVKRVIGEPGDVLEMNGGRLYRNGELLEEEYIKENIQGNFEKVVVPEDNVFVMGDNRNNSMDSRSIGPIPTEHVIGRAFLRYFPFNKMGNF